MVFILCFTFIGMFASAASSQAPRSAVVNEVLLGLQDEPCPATIPSILCRYHTSTRHQCVPMERGYCRRFGYNFTVYPNLLDHSSEAEALQSMHQFFPLVQVECSSELAALLCSYYMPMCSPGLRHPILPCRGLCERVKISCEPLMLSFGFQWPSSLQCSNLPVSSDLSGTSQVICMDRLPDSSPGRSFFGRDPTTAPTQPSETPQCHPELCTSQAIQKRTFCRHRYAWGVEGTIESAFTKFEHRCYVVVVNKRVFVQKSAWKPRRNSRIHMCSNVSVACPSCFENFFQQRMLLVGHDVREENSTLTYELSNLAGGIFLPRKTLHLKAVRKTRKWWARPPTCRR